MTHPMPTTESTSDSPVSGAPHEAVWPAGVPHHLTVPDESLVQGLARRAAAEPNQPLLHFMGREWTSQQVLDEARALAATLAGQGLAPGERALLFMQNGPAFVIAFYAVLICRAVVVPVNPMNKADELQHLIVDAQAHSALVSSDLASELVKANEGLEGRHGLTHILVHEWADFLPAGSSNPADGVSARWPAAWVNWLTATHPLPASIKARIQRWGHAPAGSAPRLALPPSAGLGDELAVLPYTSGTTGAPKGCLHTHRTLLHNAMTAGPWLDLRAGDAQLVVVPMFHITGLVMGLLAAVLAGARVVLLPRWDRSYAARVMAEQRVTHWPNIPTMVIDLLAAPDLERFDLSSLRYIGGGGAPMPEAVADRLKALFGLNYVEGYGLTETAAPSHSNPPQSIRRRCLGIPYISTRACVVDPDTLQPMPEGAVGEILINGPQVFKGYWQQAEATAQAFVTVEGRRWFRTGDLGRVDAQGYFHMADRLKRMINASGFKVWPAELEALMHHHPGVQEVCVVRSSDAYRGESVRAVVVPRAGHQPELDEASLIAWCRDHMAAYKVPRSIVFVSALPRSGSGKVMWRVVQADQEP